MVKHKSLEHLMPKMPRNHKMPKMTKAVKKMMGKIAGHGKYK